MTFEAYSVCCGKRSWMASAAACESDPGRLNVSSYAPPLVELNVKMATAMTSQAPMTRHGWRPAKWPMR